MLGATGAPAAAGRVCAGTVGIKNFFARRALRILPLHHQKYNVGFLSHLWSPVVEEQFYLLWPFFFVFLVAKPWRLVAICAAAILTYYRVAMSFNWHNAIHKVYYVGLSWGRPAPESAESPYDTSGNADISTARVG